MGANFKWECLHDLAGKWQLAVHCVCGHAGAIDAARLARWFMCHGWSTRKSRIAEHLYCSECRKKGRGRMRVGITANLPTSDPFPKNEEGWRFLVKRLRNR
jgi:hypothetical protein